MYNQSCNKDPGMKVEGGKCNPIEVDSRPEECSEGQGKEGGECVTCSAKPGGKWTPPEDKGQPCECKENPNVMKDREKCREKTCEEKGMVITESGTCITRFVCNKDPGMKVEGGKCNPIEVDSRPEECSEGQGKEGGECVTCSAKPGGPWDFEGKDKPCKLISETEEEPCTEGKSFINGECVDCPDWKKHGSFRRNGKVDSSFCNAYAKDQRACKKALAKLKSLAGRLEQYNRILEKLEERLLSLNDSEDTKTEAGGLCFDCLKRELKANRPTANQTIGNLANIIAGAGFGFAGYKAGQNAQSHANMLRIQQGYSASNDYYALQGAKAGYPFIANGLYGMTRVNTPVGGWSCTPSVNPYGHAYSQSYGHGYQMPYYR